MLNKHYDPTGKRNQPKIIHPNDTRVTKLNKLIHNKFETKDNIPSKKYRLGYYQLTSFEGKHKDFHNRDKNFIEKHIVDKLDSKNQFITVNTFSHKSRKSQYVFNLTNFYIDLDIYNSEYYKQTYNELYKSSNVYRVNHRLIKKLIKSVCNKNNLPYPSKIMYSGNGYYLFWKIRQQNVRDQEGRMFFGAPKQMSKLYKAIQRELVKAFRDLGADSSAIDVSRVLRAEGSVNTKTGECVETIFECQKRFDIKEFAKKVLPYSYNQAKEYSEKRQSEKKKSSYNQTYAQWLLAYLDLMIEKKYIKAGNTNNFMYLYFYALKINNLDSSIGYELHSTFKHQLADSELNNAMNQANNVGHSLSKTFINDFLRIGEKRNRSTKKQVKYAKMIYKIYNEQLKHLSSRNLAVYLNVGKDTANKIKRKYEQINYVYEQFLNQEIATYKPKFRNKHDFELFEWIHSYLLRISSIDDYKKWQTECLQH